MKTIANRIEKLEAEFSPRVTWVIIRNFDAGDLRGYRNSIWGEAPITVMREIGQTEERLLERAEATVQAARPVSPVLVLEEMRGAEHKQAKKE
jgi:hypothetical protein